VLGVVWRTFTVSECLQSIIRAEGPAPAALHDIVPRKSV
jgi:hypothetical protein